MTCARPNRAQTGRRAPLVVAMLLGLGAACDNQTTGPEHQAPVLLVTATEDVTAPTLTVFDFTPKEINTTAGPDTVTVTFTVTDDLAGAEWVMFSFGSPSGQHQTASTTFAPATSYSGSLSVIFPQFSEAGTWTAWARVRDAVGNGREYFPYADPAHGVEDLSALGFPTELTVVSAQDVTAPYLTAFDFSPKEINTTAGPDTVTVTFTVTDDLAGAREVMVSFSSPSGQVQTGSAAFTAATSHSGSLLVIFPQFSEAGTWTAWARAYDALGHMREYFPFADPVHGVEDLSALGFPTELTVVSAQDVTAPYLTAFDFSPKQINTAAGPATVTVTFTVTDDLAGAWQVMVSFRSPSGRVYQTGVTAFTPVNSYTGLLSVTFPRYSETGIWTAFGRVYDALWHMREYFPFADPVHGVEDLTALGFPTELLVGPTNEPPTANAGPDQIVECVGPDGTPVTLDGSASSDPDNDVLAYEWFEDGTPIAAGESPTVSFGLGVHAVTLRVTDNDGATAEDDVTITVQDTQAPAIHLAVEPTELWPPNHEMRLVARGISATDVCDPAPTLTVEVTSNEPTNGLGDGDIAPDWQVVANGDETFDVLVRAERSGTGSGRTYTIAATAADASGNRVSASRMVTVPLSRGRGSPR